MRIKKLGALILAGTLMCTTPVMPVMASDATETVQEIITDNEIDSLVSDPDKVVDIIMYAKDQVAQQDISDEQIKEIIQTAESSLLHTYNRFPIVLDHGEDVYLYDTDQKKYLDFAAGIAVFALGYSNDAYKTAVKEQVDKLVHTSNLFYNEPAAKAAKKITQLTGMNRVFFTNSGTEAIEGAIKLVRKYAYNKDGRTDHEIIAMKHSFHGRSMGALSVTGTEHYRTPFEPLIPGVKFAKYNDLDSVKALVSDKTCAIILEALQGEGGITPATDEFMKGLRQICDEEGILLICDEIQCGMGRTGSMFAWQGYGVKPDIMTMAKAIGNGVPVGAFAMTKEVAEYSLEPGDHGTTYGGNPLACAAVAKTLELFEKYDLTAHVREIGAYLTEKLDELVAANDAVLERRGIGLIQGIKVKKPVGEISSEALKEGLLIISAKGNVLRLVPPLVIEKEHVDEMLEILKKVL